MDRDTGNHSVWPRATGMDQVCWDDNLRHASPAVHKGSTEQVSDEHRRQSLGVLLLNRDKTRVTVRHFHVTKTLLASVQLHSVTKLLGTKLRPLDMGWTYDFLKFCPKSD